MAKVTTIKLKEELKRELEGLKEHPRETYEDVIERLVAMQKRQVESLAAARDIKAGEAIIRDALTIKVSSRGLSPRFLSQIVGKRALYDLKQGEEITFGMVEL